MPATSLRQGFFYSSSHFHAFSTSCSPAPALPAIATPGSKVRTCWLNFGPQHPAAHGIVRLNMQIHGEVLTRVDPQFGLLHRGTEKLVETRTTTQALPYFDRFDYVANLFQEHVYCLAVESLGRGQGTTPGPVLMVRAFFDEFSRVLNHLLTLSATSLDLSAMGPIFWAFEERERIMELYERVSGARMHTALYHPFFFDFTTLTSRFWSDCVSFLNRAGRALAGAFLGLLHNRSLKTRLGGVGQLSPAKLASYGITGVIARSAGLPFDLRTHTTRAYGAYRALSFRTFLGRRGDNLDRFLLRVKEVIESFRIISQAASSLRLGATSPRGLSRPSALGSALLGGSSPAQFAFALCAPTRLFSLRARARRFAGAVAATPAGPGVALAWGRSSHTPTPGLHGSFTGMEELISHFKWASEGYYLRPGLAYAAVEAPKGELGVTLLADGTVRPVRMKVRTPVAHNLHLIPSLGSGVFFADFVASFCSLDVVFGEIDR